MKKSIFTFIFIFIFLPSIMFSQNLDSTNVYDTLTSSKNDTISTCYNQLLYLKLPMRLFFYQDNQFNLVIHKSSNRNFSNGINKDFTIIEKEYDVNTSSFRTKILPSPITSQQKKFGQKSFPINKYELPTKEEFDVLSVFWEKGDITCPNIYSECETTLKITFDDLRKLLKRMTTKGWLERKQVSPSQYFTFQVQGEELPFKIEMSQKNRRNRVYLYHSKIEYDKMKNFILANAYNVEGDSSIMFTEKLQAARNDTNLIEYLRNRLLSIE